jgi:hypothetical protein
VAVRALVALNIPKLTLTVVGTLQMRLRTAESDVEAVPVIQVDVLIKVIGKVQVESPPEELAVYTQHIAVPSGNFV